MKSQSAVRYHSHITPLFVVASLSLLPVTSGASIAERYHRAIRGQQDVVGVYSYLCDPSAEPRWCEEVRLNFLVGPLLGRFQIDLRHLQNVAGGDASVCGDGREDVDGNGTLDEFDIVALRSALAYEVAMYLSVLSREEAGLLVPAIAPELDVVRARIMSSNAARQRQIAPDRDDSDGDGRVDACDNCPMIPNPGQFDGDDDGLGDVCENAVIYDIVAPIIHIVGVADGTVYFSPPTPSVLIEDGNLVYSTIQLDGMAFASGQAVTALGGHWLTVQAEDLAGNVSSAVIHFTLRADFPPALSAVCGTTSVRIENNALVTGAVKSNGSISVANNAAVTGSVTAGGDVSIGNNGRVTGDIALHGNLMVDHNSRHSGQVTQLSTQPTPCASDYDVAAMVASVQDVNDNGLLDNSVLLGANLHAANNATVALPAGDFYLSAIEVDDNARVTAQPGALVRLFVAGDITVGNNSSLGADSGNGGRMLVVSSGGRASLENNTACTLDLYAPLATIDLANNAYLQGSLVGGEVVVHNNGTFAGR